MISVEYSSKYWSGKKAPFFWFFRPFSVRLLPGEASRFGALWLLENVRDGFTVATPDVGMQGYFVRNVKIIDMVGLCDNYIARLPNKIVKREKFSTYYYASKGKKLDQKERIFFNYTPQAAIFTFPGVNSFYLWDQKHSALFREYIHIRSPEFVLIYASDETIPQSMKYQRGYFPWDNSLLSDEQFRKNWTEFAKYKTWAGWSHVFKRNDVNTYPSLNEKIKRFKKAIAENPRMPMIPVRLAEILYAEGREKEAIFLFEKTKQKFPENFYVKYANDFYKKNGVFPRMPIYPYGKID